VFASFTNPNVFKTDAPIEFLRSVKAEWEKVNKEKDYTSPINFSDNPEVKQMLKNTPPRFLPNPEKNWGPKSAAKIKQTLKAKTKGESDLVQQLDNQHITEEELANHKKVKLN